VTNIEPGQSGSVGLYGDVDTSLIRLLTILVAVLAGLGVLSAVLMATRERVHDLGVCKAVGMPAPAGHRHGHLLGYRPRHRRCDHRPARRDGTAKHRHARLAADQAVLPQTLGTPPASLVHVYTPAGLTLLALAGLAIAIVGALGPATRAAVSRTTTALHAE
jgi:putative ABC transport system permease protein